MHGDARAAEVSELLRVLLFDIRALQVNAAAQFEAQAALQAAVQAQAQVA